MKDKEFLEFLTTNQNTPKGLYDLTRKDVLLSFRGRVILRRFIAFQVLGALISLTFCPQFGMSFFVEGHGFTHHLRMIGDWACAAFCGSLFLSAGNILALFFMEWDEFLWAWNHKKWTLVILPAVFWGALMSFNLTLGLPSETLAYHLTWIFAAIVTQVIVFKTRSLKSLAPKRV